MPQPQQQGYSFADYFKRGNDNGWRKVKPTPQTGAIVPYHSPLNPNRPGAVAVPRRIIPATTPRRTINLPWRKAARFGRLSSPLGALSFAVDLMELSAPGVHRWLKDQGPGAGKRARSGTPQFTGGQAARVPYRITINFAYNENSKSLPINSDCRDKPFLSETLSFDVWGPISNVRVDNKDACLLSGTPAVWATCRGKTSSAVNSLQEWLIGYYPGISTKPIRLTSWRVVSIQRLDGFPDINKNQLAPFPNNLQRKSNPKQLPITPIYPRPIPNQRSRNTPDQRRGFKPFPALRGNPYTPRRLNAYPREEPSPQPEPSPNAKPKSYPRLLIKPAPPYDPNPHRPEDDCAADPCNNAIFDFLEGIFDRLPAPSSEEKPQEDCPELEQIDLPYTVCHSANGEEKPQTLLYRITVLKGSFPLSDRQLFQDSATLAVKGCLNDPIASVPEWWQVRLGADRPQLVIQFGVDLGNGRRGPCKYPLTIPHYNRSKGFKPSIPSYTKGQWEGILTLVDNSKLIVNAISKAEAERVIRACKTYISPASLAGSFSKVGERKGQELQQVRVVPVVAKFFATGQQNMNPDWAISLE